MVLSELWVWFIGGFLGFVRYIDAKVLGCAKFQSVVQSIMWRLTLGLDRLCSKVCLFFFSLLEIIVCQHDNLSIDQGLPLS